MFLCLLVCLIDDTMEVGIGASMATQTKSRQKNRRQHVPSGAMQVVRIVKTNREPKLELRDKLAMTREVFGRLVNVSVRAISAAELNQKNVAKLQRPYAEVARLYEALSDVVEPPTIGRWFVTPNDALGGLKPIEVVERGDGHDGRAAPTQSFHLLEWPEAQVPARYPRRGTFT
jgi:DNA-binding transcriptional regulator YiaG